MGVSGDCCEADGITRWDGGVFQSGIVAGDMARVMAGAYRAWDRSTAYMCRLRGVRYDDVEQCCLKVIWDGYIDRT